MKKILFSILVFLLSFNAHAQMPEIAQPYFLAEGDWIVTTHASFNGNAIDTLGNVSAIVIYFPKTMVFTIHIVNDAENDSVENLWFPVTREEYGHDASVKYLSNDDAELVIYYDGYLLHVSVAYVSTSQKRPVIYRYNGVFYMEEDVD